MLTTVGIVYLVGMGVSVGMSIGLATFVTLITLGSEAGMEIAGKIVLSGVVKSPLWPVLMPYNFIKGKFGK